MLIFLKILDRDLNIILSSDDLYSFHYWTYSVGHKWNDNKLERTIIAWIVCDGIKSIG